MHGFEEWREELLNRLRGMFAFAIWNRTDKSLFIACLLYTSPLHPENAMSIAAAKANTKPFANFFMIVSFPQI